jgi:predicted transcriptional regulator of viral defense system
MGGFWPNDVRPEPNAVRSIASANTGDRKRPGHPWRFAGRFSYGKTDDFGLFSNMMLDQASTLRGYILKLQSEGRISFTSEEASTALGIKHSAFQKSAARLQKKGLLLNPRHGFHVIVPPQYHSWEAPPPSWYIDDLMRHEGRVYYVGLLKAAEIHGATHHAVMEFQVVTDKQLSKIRAGRSFIAFYFRKNMAAVLEGVESHKTDTGSMKISSAELTALDLLRYLHVVGGIDSVATILTDLGSRLDASKLARLALHFERTTIQRLGYLLDRLGYPASAEALRNVLFSRSSVPWVQLEPMDRKQPNPDQPPLERNERWRVAIYRHPETDE